MPHQITQKNSRYDDDDGYSFFFGWWTWRGEEKVETPGYIMHHNFRHLNGVGASFSSQFIDLCATLWNKEADRLVHSV